MEREQSGYLTYLLAPTASCGVMCRSDLLSRTVHFGVIRVAGKRDDLGYTEKHYKSHTML